MNRMDEPYHSLSQILQHERESTRGVCHGIGTVEDNEGIEGCIVELDLGRNANPI